MFLIYYILRWGLNNVPSIYLKGQCFVLLTYVYMSVFLGLYSLCNSLVSDSLYDLVNLAANVCIFGISSIDTIGVIGNFLIRQQVVIRSPEHPANSQSLYRLHYPALYNMYELLKFL
jgi:hypothetical protein